MIVYLSGPMTGYVNYNRDAFDAAEHSLRKRFPHLGIINPATLDENTDGWSHADYIRRDLALLLEADAIYLLPGWRWSKGASIEEAVARACGLLVLEDPDKDLWRTFEGEPESDQEPLRYEVTDGEGRVISQRAALDHSDCEAVQGDGEGNAWCEHGQAVEDPPAQSPASAGAAPPGDEDLADHPRFGAAFADLGIDYVIDDSLPPNTLRVENGPTSIDYQVTWDENGMHLHPKGFYRHEDLDKPREGDEFPNVGYVRRFLAIAGLPQPGKSYLDFGGRRSA